MSENIKYNKNGFGIKTLPVQEFNAQVLNGSLKERGISSLFYVILNNKGLQRKFGYVAFTYDNAYFCRTKKGAIKKLKNTFDSIW